MDTLGFLRTILPDTGVYYLALFKKGQNAPAHVAYTSLEDMAAAVEKYDRSGKVAVYHACSSYNEPFIEVEGKKTYRRPTNWNRAKSLWVDIDCGEDKATNGKGYADKHSACVAIGSFCATTKFPRPIVVDSGNGIHCYWPLTKAIKPLAWQGLANRLQAVLAHFNVLVDTTCTTDFARILRPVGSTNRKRTDKPVRFKLGANPTPPELLRDYLANISTVYGVAGAKPATLPASNLNEDLTAHVQHIHMDSSAVEVSKRCAQVAFMRDTKGDVSYDHWRAVIGLIKHCVEGIKLAREWSEERANTGHESVDVLTRYETWNAGPPTCEFFSQHNPGGCDKCEHKGKIKSPIVLGRILPESEAKTVEAIVDGNRIPVEVPKLPEGYKWENNLLIRYVRDKDGIWHPNPFCWSLFYPTHRVHREDGSYCIGVRMHLPDGRTREFDVDTGLLASPQKLMERLGSAGEIVQTNDKEASMNMTAYLRESLELLKTKAQELNTMTTFGWKNDMQAFLIGDRLYHADGTVRKVLVGGYAADHLHHFPTPKGSVESYAKALNHVYGRRGMEPMQYAIASGFGSILTPFGENLYHGLLVALMGGESGRGKTTVCQSVLWAFGDAFQMTVKGMKGSTDNALFAQMGAYGSIPMLCDEYTNADPEAFSTFAFRVSEGQEKSRLGVSKGGIRKMAQAEWEMSPFLTANKDLHAVLADHSSNSQAEAVRLIQLRVDEYDMPKFAEGEVDSAVTQMRLSVGSAGEAFIRYVVTHRDDVFALFQQTVGEISPHIPGPKYRYYRNHAVASMTAIQITNKLGITQFDIPALIQFTIRLMQKLCENVTETNMVTPEDALSYMINDLGPRIISTTEYRDARDARGPELVKRVYAAVAGRYIIGGADKKEKMAGRLYLIKKEMKDWCSKNRIELNSVLDYARKSGFLIHESERFTVTRGTELSTINLRCVALDMNKMSDAVTQSLKLVVHTNPHADNDEAGMGVKH